MARPPKPGKCVHCLRPSVERNWDHVCPESWYPESTPKNLAKWQIPSCLPCNRRLGAIESDFLRRISMCLDPNDPASQGLAARALRSMKPEFARNASDARARVAAARRFTAELLHGEQIPDEGHYPNLGERSSRPKTEATAFLIPEASFQAVTEKIVRGIAYIENRTFIAPPYRVQFIAVADEAAAHVRGLLDEHGSTFALEPGIVVRRVVAPEDGISAIYELEFWKQLKTFASVLNDA